MSISDKTYLVNINGLNVASASNLLTAYKIMLHKLPEYCKSNILSYSQVWRLWKTKQEICFLLPDREPVHIKEFKTHHSFDSYLDEMENLHHSKKAII